jgi:hypothetical protein
MKKYTLLVVFIALASYMQAQKLTPEVICAGSGTITNGVTNIYWTIGETIVSTMQSGNNQLSNGFQQSNYIITAIKNNTVQYDIKLFPNPTTDLLNLQIKVSQIKDAHFQLLDVQGKIIKEDKLQNELNQIDCSLLMPSVYWIRIEDASNQLIQTFKIIKQ